jgi:hypothetical protein
MDIFLSLMPFVYHVVLFKLSERTFGSCAFCYAIVTANSTEYAFAENFNRHSYASSVSKFFGFAVNAHNILLSNGFLSMRKTNNLPKLGSFRFEFKELSYR